MSFIDETVEPGTEAPTAIAPTPTPLPPPPPPVPARRRLLRSTARVGALVVLCGTVSGGVAYTTVQLTQSDTGVSYITRASGSAPVDPGDALDIHEVLDKVQPAVTAIEVGQRDGDAVIPVAAGSGVVISEDGLMLTNAHVVDLSDSGVDPKDAVFLVKMFDGTVRSAAVLGTSADYDIALLQLDDTTDLHPLALADTSALRVGDRVVAVGNALDLGDEPTVSTGIVSALDRTLEVTSTVTLRGLIQTDAAINHGNSGGALVNGAGELVGINSAGIPNAQNVGFAISAGTIIPLLDDLKAGRTIKPAPIGYIGVLLTETPEGITISKVEDGTPAAEAGIEAGDIIVKVNDTTVNTADQLGKVLRSLPPGTEVRITVDRNGTTRVFGLTLATRPNA